MRYLEAISGNVPIYNILSICWEVVNSENLEVLHVQ